MKGIILLLLLALVVPAGASMPMLHILYGFVYNDSGIPLPGIEITVLNTATGESIRTITEGTGGWSVNLADFSYQENDLIRISAGDVNTSLLVDLSSITQKVSDLILSIPAVEEEMEEEIEIHHSPLITTLYKGRNLIGWINNDTFAELACQDIPNATKIFKIYRADRVKIGLTTHECGTPIDNFTVDYGVAYFLDVSADTEWIRIPPRQGVTLNITDRWNPVAWTVTRPTSAEEICRELGLPPPHIHPGAAIVAYNPITKKFDLNHVCGWEIENFTITQGMGFLIGTHLTLTWVQYAGVNISLKIKDSINQTDQVVEPEEQITVSGYVTYAEPCEPCGGVPGKTVNITVDNIIMETAMTDSAGYYEATFPAPSTTGNYTVNVSAEDEVRGRNSTILIVQDNCPSVYNPDQLDSDNDGAGDLCDPCPFDDLDQCDPAYTAGATIGRDGAQLENDPWGSGIYEAKIFVPESAVPENTSFAMMKDPTISPGYGIKGGNVIYFGYNFGPICVTFGSNIKITFNYTQYLAEITNEANLRIVRYDPVTESVTDILLTECDIINKTCSAEVDHFSLIVLLEIPDLDIDPDTLNLKSKGGYITAYIELPRPFSVRDIDITTVKLNDIVPAESKPVEIGDYDSDGIQDLMVKFDRRAVQDLLDPADEVEIIVTGEVAEIPFTSVDVIRVI